MASERARLRRYHASAALVSTMVVSIVPFRSFPPAAEAVPIFLRRRGGAPDPADHDTRSAVAGSTRTTRLAGIHAASSAAASRDPAARIHAAGSHGVTLNSTLVNTRTVKNAPTAPSATPVS